MLTVRGHGKVVAVLAVTVVRVRIRVRCTASVWERHRGRADVMCSGGVVGVVLPPRIDGLDDGLGIGPIIGLDGSCSSRRGCQNWWRVSNGIKVGTLG